MKRAWGLAAALAAVGLTACGSTTIGQPDATLVPLTQATTTVPPTTSSSSIEARVARGIANAQAHGSVLATLDAWTLDQVTRTYVGACMGKREAVLTVLMLNEHNGAQQVYDVVSVACPERLGSLTAG